jgi:hypothetical protein
MTVGVISDTHAMLHPGVAAAFAGVDHILHAGDIGSTDIVRALERIAPVTAISGNADAAPLSRLPAERVLELAGVPIVMVHQGLVRGRPTPQLAAALRAHAPAVVVFGHSHVALVERRDGVLFVNPGGGGRRRFRMPRSVALLSLRASGVDASLWMLDA